MMMKGPKGVNRLRVEAKGKAKSMVKGGRRCIQKKLIIVNVIW
jgi:hypothetical protein